MATTSEVTRSWRLWLFYLTPSWLSSFLSVLLIVLLAGGTVLWQRYGGLFTPSLQNLHTAYSQSNFSSYVQIASQHLLTNNIIGNVIYFLFWCLVGMGVYIMVIGIIKEFQSSREVVRELSYVHVRRATLLLNVFSRALLRITALAGWIGGVWLAIYKLFPLVASVIHLCSSITASVLTWVACAAVLCGCFVYVHALLTLLRLVFLRGRLLSDPQVLPD